MAEVNGISPSTTRTPFGHEMGKHFLFDEGYTNLSELDADFFVSNCHKWLLTPRACALFHVPVRNQGLIRSTLPTSHGFQPRKASSPCIVNPLAPASSACSAFQVAFEFTGTMDNSPYLCLPAARRFCDEVCGGEEAIRRYCARLAAKGGRRVAEMWRTETLERPFSSSTTTFFANIRLPLPPHLLSSSSIATPQKIIHRLHRSMLDQQRTFIPLCEHGHHGQGTAIWARFSAMIYLDLSDYERGARVLGGLCADLVEDLITDP